MLAGRNSESNDAATSPDGSGGDGTQPVPDGSSGDGTQPVPDGGRGDSAQPVPERDAIDDEGYAIGSGRSGVVRQIDHDDFDPIGTLVLIAIYMAIVGVMWVFMYFVEFLGGDLTVIG